jgi:hypothetical protein
MAQVINKIGSLAYEYYWICAIVYLSVAIIVIGATVDELKKLIKGDE